MEEFKNLPSSMSHKKLKSLLSTAQKEFELKDHIKAENNPTNFALNELLICWADLTKKLSNEFQSKNICLEKNKETKSIMALGAMEAHINMALNAYKLYQSEEGS